MSFHGLSADDVLDGELDVQVLDFVTQILKSQFHPQYQYGLLPPSRLYALEMSGASHPKIPHEEFAVQIHIIPGHYMVSAQMNGRLHVYDSLYSISHLNAVVPQLRILYEDDMVTNVIYTCPQTQGCSNLCGFFAIANAYNLLTGVLLKNVSLNISSMRTHLQNCLLDGKLTSFPRSTVIEPYKRREDLLDNYFKSQEILKEIHCAKITENKVTFQNKHTHFDSKREQQRRWKRRQREKLTTLDKDLISIKEKDRKRKANKRKSLKENEQTKLKNDKKSPHQKRKKLFNKEDKTRLKHIIKPPQQHRTKWFSAEDNNTMKNIHSKQECRRKFLRSEERNRLQNCNRLNHLCKRHLFSQQKLKRLKQCHNRLHNQHKQKSRRTEMERRLRENGPLQHNKTQREEQANLHASYKAHMSKAHEAVKKKKNNHANITHTKPSESNREKQRRWKRRQREKLTNMEKTQLKYINKLQHEQRRKSLKLDLYDKNNLQIS